MHGVQGAALAPVVRRLMDVVWMGVIGVRTRAKAASFMYGEVVAPGASLRHNRVLETPPASALWRGSASCARPGHAP